MALNMIVAVSENGVIGRDGKMPWHLPKELKIFKDITLGHNVVMGRKTFDAIGRPLRGRTNFVVSREQLGTRDDVNYISTWDKLLEIAYNEEVFIIGGEQIYRIFLPLVKNIYLTEVHAKVQGDTYFPIFDRSNWKIIEEKCYEKDELNTIAFTTFKFERLNL